MSANIATWGRQWRLALLGWSLFGAMSCSTAADIEIHVTSAQGLPVEDMAVLLESPTLKGRRAQRGAAIAQKDREFSPYLSIVQTGTAVDFPNRDPLKHHVYSFSPAKTFEIKLYAGKPEKPVTFDKPGEVALGCNIHDWMEAYLLVVDTPYFAKTGMDGKAVLTQLPSGHFTVRLWHPRSSQALPVREVDLQGDTHLTLQATVVVAPRVHKPKPALESSGY